MTTWNAFERAARDLARRGRERFERTHLALIATLREDGSPRISPIEPYILGGHLVIGVMRSAKQRDLRRDPRCALHSRVTDINASEGEFKIYGRAVPLDRSELRGADSDAWWAGRPKESYVLFSIEIDSASFVTYDLPQEEIQIVSWSPDSGLRELRRPYP
jgi:hypothetical protein